MSVCGCIKRFVHPNYKYTYFLTHLYQAMQTGSICIEFCDADRIEMSLLSMQRVQIIGRVQVPFTG